MTRPRDPGFWTAPGETRTGTNEQARIAKSVTFNNINSR
jgi:hypothetical protein